MLVGSYYIRYGVKQYTWYSIGDGIYQVHECVGIRLVRQKVDYIIRWYQENSEQSIERLEDIPLS